MRMSSLALLLAAAVSTPALGQEVGTCEPATAQALLDVNDVRASIYNGGNLFWRGSGNVYTVPKLGRANSIFVAQIWVGGMVGDELRMAGTDYGPMEFWPGPLDDAGRPPVDCEPYDRIYDIKRKDIVEYQRSGVATPDLLDWPVYLGAPVLDGDGIPTNYDLQQGDRPALIGDQMLWWVMNDAGNSHRNRTTPPLGLEVHATAFAATKAPVSLRYYAFAGQLESALRLTTFYRYQLVYKGDKPLENAWFAFWVDAHLGDPSDDFVGTDSVRGMGFVYNGDDSDGAADGYGKFPPALGADFFRGPVAMLDSLDNDRDGEVDELGERSGTEVAWNYPDSYPRLYAPEGRYLMMKGFWPTGEPMRIGDTWRPSNQSMEITRFMFSGNPPSFWSEENLDGFGGRYPPGDRRFMVSTGPFRMDPGESQEIVVGLVWARGRDRFDSIRLMKTYDEIIQLFIDDLLTPSVPPPEPVILPEGYALVRNYPNPFTDRTTISYALPRQEHVHLTVYDILGRAVETLVDGIQSPGPHEVAFESDDLPPGVYFYEFAAGPVRGSHKMVISR